MNIVCYCSNSEFIKKNSEFLYASNMEGLESLLIDNDDCIVIVDIKMIKSKEDIFFQYMKNTFVATDVFCLSSSPNFIEGSHLLTFQIKGYGNLHMAKIHIKDAINVIKNGEIWLYPEFLQQIIKSFTKATISSIHTNKEELSRREEEIVNLLKQGFNNKEIAELSNITERTVKAHVSAIYHKLHVRDRVSLILKLR